MTSFPPVLRLADMRLRHEHFGALAWTTTQPRRFWSCRARLPWSRCWPASR